MFNHTNKLIMLSYKSLTLTFKTHSQQRVAIVLHYLVAVGAKSNSVHALRLISETSTVSKSAWWWTL